MLGAWISECGKLWQMRSANPGPQIPVVLPRRTEANSAKGQCAVTACVVHDYLVGYILNTVATLPNNETVSHYFISYTARRST
ncbi:YunG family protein [Nocardia abscessus]|uniref:YunG family protein n=1 Tax=Nocardia abscessus TaxID=120957 RepID=UPI003CC7D3EB